MPLALAALWLHCITVTCCITVAAQDRYRGPPGRARVPLCPGEAQRKCSSSAKRSAWAPACGCGHRRLAGPWQRQWRATEPSFWYGGSELLPLVCSFAELDSCYLHAAPACQLRLTGRPLLCVCRRLRQRRQHSMVAARKRSWMAWRRTEAFGRLRLGARRHRLAGECMHARITNPFSASRSQQRCTILGRCARARA